MLGDFRAQAQKLSDVALATLVRALSDEDARVRVSAAKEILDRAWGRPALEIEIETLRAKLKMLERGQDPDGDRRVVNIVLPEFKKSEQ